MPSDEPLTLEHLRAAMRKLDELGRAPLPATYSRHATALPSGKPRTDDMREMVERLGVQRVPTVIRLKTMFGERLIIHPDLLKKRRNQA